MACEEEGDHRHEQCDGGSCRDGSGHPTHRREECSDGSCDHGVHRHEQCGNGDGVHLHDECNGDEPGEEEEGGMEDKRVPPCQRE